MKKQYQKATLPGHRREMGVRDSAAEAVETANPAKSGETAPPNQSPDNNAPVTQAEFREATLITRSEFKEEISDVKVELKEDIHKLERRLLWATLSATGGLALLVIGAMLH